MNPSTDITDIQTRDALVSHAYSEATDRLEAAGAQTPAEILTLCGKLATTYTLTSSEAAYLAAECLLWDYHRATRLPLDSVCAFEMAASALAAVPKGDPYHWLADTLVPTLRAAHEH